MSEVLRKGLRHFEQEDGFLVMAADGEQLADFLRAGLAVAFEDLVDGPCSA